MDWSVVKGVLAVITTIFAIFYPYYFWKKRQPNLRIVKSVAVLREPQKTLAVRLKIRNTGEKGTAADSIEYFCDSEKMTSIYKQRDIFPIEFNHTETVPIHDDFRGVAQAKIGGVVICRISYDPPKKTKTIKIPITPPP